MGYAVRPVWSAATAAVVLGATLCGPFLTPHRTDDPIVAPYASPSVAAPLGGDHLGRDVLSRLLAGGAELLLVSATVAVVVTLLAALLGTLAVLRPAVGRVVERGADVLILLPPVLGVLLIVLSWPGGGPVALITAAVLLGLPYAVRVVAAAAAPVAWAGFVQAAVVGGERLGRVLWREVLPNLRGVLVALLGLRFVAATYLVATAAFLQVGPQPPAANWALMVRENGEGVLLNPWAVIAPSLAIGVLAVAVHLAADRLAPARHPLHAAGL
jgi:peptide/nickel transport system permease protein